MWFTLLNFLARAALTHTLAINPVVTRDRRFIDSVTNETFYVKGVDYQPGGSSGYVGNSDPLSDVETCARDIYLFQQLGINAIRVYSVNPYMDHDQCMTLLARAGIYVILDVNSPLFGESLNRYEPWTTYNPSYLDRVFKVVEHFSSYNNTLAFFAGNEIINDERSAMYPHYIKAVVRDMKAYIAKHSPRQIPVGYSAADDLRYRKSLSSYLECGDTNATLDFYGVNSYQWCGEQTFQSSGFESLVFDYKDYSLPLILSEYGCNIIKPRIFQEIEGLYSPQMSPVFSGGLVYEYTMEPNSYGLVELDQQGSVYLTTEFETVRKQMHKVKNVVDTTPKSVNRTEVCQGVYENLMAFEEVPPSQALELIENGVNVTRGSYVPLSIEQTSFRIYDTEGVEITNKTIVEVQPPVVELPRDKLELKVKELKGKNTTASNSTHTAISKAVNFHTQISTGLMAISMALNMM